MQLNRSEILMPGGIDLSFEAINNVEINSETRILSIACGTGEIELFFANKYKCNVVGIDTSENFISRAQSKADKLGLDNITFLIGDGNKLEFGDENFDIIFCSAAISEFYNNGLMEFYRILKPHGKAVIIELIWRNKEVPKDVQKIWAGDTAVILTEEDNYRIFHKNNFLINYSRQYNKSSWWEEFYDDRGSDEHWKIEKANYYAHRKFIEIGLFIIEKN